MATCQRDTWKRVSRTIKEWICHITPTRTRWKYCRRSKRQHIPQHMSKRCIEAGKQNDQRVNPRVNVAKDKLKVSFTTAGIKPGLYQTSTCNLCTWQVRQCTLVWSAPSWSTLHNAPWFYQCVHCHRFPRSSAKVVVALLSCASRFSNNDDVTEQQFCANTQAEPRAGPRGERLREQRWKIVLATIKSFWLVLIFAICPTIGVSQVFKMYHVFSTGHMFFVISSSYPGVKKTLKDGFFQ